MIKDWRGNKESDQDLVRTTQEYMAMLNNSEIKPTEEERQLGEQVKGAMGKFICYRITSWSPENRKSETQIKEMIMMCNESTLMIMLKNKTVEFISKIWEFPNKAEGRAGRKIMNLMMNREHTNFKILTKTNTKKANAKESEWPDVDPNKARELNK